MALAKIPFEFRGVSLESLEPRSNRHRKQTEIIPKLQSEPEGNYFLCGRFGTGKTQFLWALYRRAVESGRNVIACSLNELLDEFKAFIQASQGKGDLVYPRLSADMLKKNQKYAIFLDDIDKARPTEYAAEQFSEIVNAIYEFQHQVVITTNLNVAELVQHFNRADPRYGGAIVRRLTHSATVYELF